MSLKVYSMYDGAYNSSVRTLYKTNVMHQNSIRQLSTGIRINSAADDVAGLSLTTKLNTVLMANNTAKNNTQTGLNMLNTAESSIGSMVDSLQRIRNLALQAANGVYSASERDMLQKEITERITDIKQNYMSAKFGDKKLFNNPVNNTNLIKPIDQLSASEITTAGYDENHTIRTAADFASKIQADLGGNFILAGDIDLSSLGTVNNSIIGGTFAGQLDGNGHSISNYNIDTGGAATDDLGLFSQLSASGIIKNLEVKSFSVSGLGNNTGGLVGQIVGGTVDNCVASGTVTGFYQAGVLAGFNNSGGSITYSSSSGSATTNGNWRAGGLVGCNDGGSVISNSYSTASVSNPSSYSAGGLTGSNRNGAVIQNSYATGAVSGWDNVGGLVGYNTSGATISNSYATGNVTATVQSAGGLAGWIDGGSIDHSYAEGGVISSSDPGGLVGVGSTGSVDNTNFYKNNMSSDGGSAVDANTSPLPTGSWDTNIWDLSGTAPKLKAFNTSSGTSTEAISLQIGVDTQSYSQLDINTDFDLGSMNFDVLNPGSALDTVDQVDSLINSLNGVRSDIGAQANKLTTILNLQEDRILDYSAAKSTIMDTDIASVQSDALRGQILQSFASSVFQQAKNINKSVLLGILQF